MRLLRLSLALVTIFSIVVLTVRFTTTANLSSAAKLFTNPDGTPCQLPCLFGIQIDKTQFDEARALLETHPLIGPRKTYMENKDYSSKQVTGFDGSWKGKGDLEGRVLWITISKANDGRVSKIDFYEALPITIEPEQFFCTTLLGELINFLGTPAIGSDRAGIIDRVFLFQHNSLTAPVVPTEAESYLLHIYRPSPNDCVTRIIIQNPYEVDPKPAIRWCGFTQRLCY